MDTNNDNVNVTNDEDACICLPVTSNTNNRNSMVGAFARNCQCCGPNKKSYANSMSNVSTNNDIKLRARVTVITETNTNLASIHSLINEIEKTQSKKMLMMMKAIIIVGVVNDRLAVVQHNTSLMLVNYHWLCKDLFYQLTIRRFAVTKPLVLSSPIDIFQMMRAAMDSPEAKWDASLGLTKEDISSAACATLVEKREMLQEYFNIGITDDGMLTTMPLLLEGYYPASIRLPLFLLRLAVEVDWTDEIACFQSVAVELSNYHAYIHLPSSKVTLAEESSSYSSLEMIENVLLPSLKNHLIPNENAINAFTQIASLEQLYKIFERC
jgi:DNA mismatch repair protein MLH1